MRRLRWPALLGLVFTVCVVGCNKDNSAHRNSADEPGGAASIAATPVAPAAKPAPSAAASAAAANKAARLNEDGSETDEDAAADTGARNPLLAAVASTVAAATPSASAVPLSGPSLWKEGVNYTRLVPAQPTDAPSGQVEVLEFFWYACPHCAALEPVVESWKKSKPSWITFTPVHVMWSEPHRNLARLYYTLNSLNKIDQMQNEVFKEIHVNNDSLLGSDPSNAADAERAQAIFVRRFGISDTDFHKAYHDMSVQAAMQRGDELVQRYRITAVPTFVVNGRYVADVGTAGGPERLLVLVGDLAAQEHKH